MGDHVRLIELHRVLTNERAAAESRMAEPRCFDKRVHAVEDDSEPLGMGVRTLTS